MNRSLKGLTACMILIISLTIFISTAKAQVGFGFPPYSYSPSSNRPISNRSTIIESDILVEDFEYSYSIFNLGWSQVQSHMTFGPDGKTPIFDSLKESWVLEGYHPESMFSQSTPSMFSQSTPYANIQFAYDLFTPLTDSKEPAIDHINLDMYPIVSFYYRATDYYRATEVPKEFEFNVGGLTKSGYKIMLKIIFNKLPKETLQSQLDSSFVKIDKKNASYSEKITVIYEESLSVSVYVLDEIEDNFWHDVWVDVFRTIKEAVDHYDDIEYKEDWYMDQATQIMISSYNFRIDDIFFRAKRSYSSRLCNPDLFEMGPLYAQVLKSNRFLFIADYEGAGITVHDINGQVSECSQITDIMLNTDNFLLVQDPDDPNDPVVRYWTDEIGADPNLFGQNDPNVAKIFDRDSFIVDLSLPIFADSDLRMGPNGPGSMADIIINSETLGWNFRAASFPSQGKQGVLMPLPIYPYDGMPTYLPARYSVIDLIKTYGKPYYSPEHVRMLEGALWNSGITVWPNITTIDYKPQYFEDQIMTIEVTDGINHDVRKFPISVVQYPVENYKPVLQLPVEDLIFFVDEAGETHLNFIDPDCFIFSMSSSDNENKHPPGFPISEYFRTDMDDLYWGIKSIAIDGEMSSLPYVCCDPGPWYSCYVFDSLMDDFDYCYFKQTGLIQFTPQSEKILDIGIIVNDAKGGNCLSEIKINCISRSDIDGDLIYDSLDNCPDTFNPDQADINENNIGDACEDTQDKPDNKQGNTSTFSYNQYWQQISNFFGLMPQVFSGYQPNIKAGWFLDIIQMPYFISFPGNYGNYGYWPAPTDNLIMNYSYSEGLYRNDFLSPLKDPYPEDSFIYLWMFPIVQSRL